MGNSASGIRVADAPDDLFEHFFRVCAEHRAQEVDRNSHLPPSLAARDVCAVAAVSRRLRAASANCGPVMWCRLASLAPPATVFETAAPGRHKRRRYEQPFLLTMPTREQLSTEDGREAATALLEAETADALGLLRRISVVGNIGEHLWEVWDTGYDESGRSIGAVAALHVRCVDSMQPPIIVIVSTSRNFSMCEVSSTSLGFFENGSFGSLCDVGMKLSEIDNHDVYPVAKRLAAALLPAGSPLSTAQMLGIFVVSAYQLWNGPVVDLESFDASEASHLASACATVIGAGRCKQQDNIGQTPDIIVPDLFQWCGKRKFCNAVRDLVRKAQGLQG